MKSNKTSGFWVWLFSVFILFVLCSNLITAGLVRHALLEGNSLTERQRQFALNFAATTSNIKYALRLVLGYEDTPLLLKKGTTEKASWTRSFPSPEDNGYLLLSGTIPPNAESGVQLIRISDGKIFAEWHPDWEEINAKTPDRKYFRKGNPKYLRALHPLLLENGDLIFSSTGGPMVRLSLCESSPTWVTTDIHHHSTEFDIDGQTLWSPSVSPSPAFDNDWLNNNLRDDSISRISLDGKTIENRSFSKILITNGLATLLLGHSGNTFNNDPIHMNQISVAPASGPYWEKGDLLISSRHLSTVFLYRPSTDKIIWHQSGPWMNQHAARFVDNQKISIFDNNVFGGAPHSAPFLEKDGINRIFIYDFSKKEASEPYKALLEKTKPTTISEGLARVLDDGGLFLEESNYGRHLRFTKDKLLWSRVNDYDDKRIGLLSWSRYLTEEEARTPLEAIAGKLSANPSCSKTSLQQSESPH
jgi:Arylsulfotransferase (ASST)